MSRLSYHTEVERKFLRQARCVFVLKAGVWQILNNVASLQELTMPSAIVDDCQWYRKSFVLVIVFPCDIISALYFQKENYEANGQVMFCRNVWGKKEICVAGYIQKSALGKFAVCTLAV